MSHNALVGHSTRKAQSDGLFQVRHRQAVPLWLKFNDLGHQGLESLPQKDWLLVRNVNSDSGLSPPFQLSALVTCILIFSCSASFDS